MKTKLILSLALLLSIFSSCNDDNQIFAVTDIDGEWSLVNISGGEAGVNTDFAEGLIKWTIDGELLTIVNNNPSSDYDAYESGNYSISVIENDEAFYLVFDGREYGKIILFSNNEMTIDQNDRTYNTFNDLFQLKFKK